MNALFLLLSLVSSPTEMAYSGEATVPFKYGGQTVHQISVQMKVNENKIKSYSYEFLSSGPGFQESKKTYSKGLFNSGKFDKNGEFKINDSNVRGQNFSIIVKLSTDRKSIESLTYENKDEGSKVLFLKKSAEEQAKGIADLVNGLGSSNGLKSNPGSSLMNSQSITNQNTNNVKNLLAPTNSGPASVTK